MTEPLETYRQYTQRVRRELTHDYPDASSADVSEVAQGACYREQWVRYATDWMKRLVPTGHELRILRRELGDAYIWRRVFHDAPGVLDRWVQAGRLLH